ncbi:hypothetical protein H696_00324 [Fonticula alba]|uniref:Rho GDP-dissociation inhibitor n=1 Tax=Fonticula alba TaxID=691883 RepID=A0A058ZEB3_FONAL|nr:hypothetical protein H696_00324 [Fonticula alba]KCV72745.1 hypothetical protein H696_00324 [Fonticula alba]|eukprot:XP_009492446.1 hypothetical protein H696_00324 [Fonticula alba]
MSTDEFAPQMTEGYKTPKAVTLSELQDLDKEDEAMNKWKASLVKETYAPADDPRRVVVLSMTLSSPDRPDITLELNSSEKVQELKKLKTIIKEGSTYRISVNFRVQHEIVTGLKFLHVIKRKGITVEKIQEMIGSYAPQLEPHTKSFHPEEAPSGMMFRGNYVGHAKFTDDDGNIYLEWEWPFEIKKEWE